MSDVTYSIKEVSEQCGWSIHMLRYYEKEGLLPPIDRDENGHRCYTVANMRLIEMLNRLRMTGMPINQMRAFSQTYQHDANGQQESLPERLQILREHREKVLAQVEALHQNLEAIEYKIDLYETQLEEKERYAEAQTT